MRDPRTDPLITPANSALVIIDYQPNQIGTVKSMDAELLVRNIVSVARLGKAYGLPIVLSTVNAAAGQGPTLRALKDVLSDNVEIDRTQINSWEDVEFRKAVEATGRKKLMDGGVPRLPGAGRPARRLRGVPRRRCGRWHVGGSAPGWSREDREGRSATDQLGVPGV
jgi:hypothetical protein